MTRSKISFMHTTYALRTSEQKDAEFLFRVKTGVIELLDHDEKLHWVEKDEFPKYRNEQGWRDWPNKCPREKWNKIKGI